jgi:alcohol dehydrogenase class IV
MGERIESLSEKEAAGKAIDGLTSLLKDVGILKGLREFGVKKEDFAGFADTVYEVSYRHIEANPRHFSKEDVIRIYENAW